MIHKIVKSPKEGMESTKILIKDHTAYIKVNIMKLAAVLVFLAGFMLLFNASVYAAQAWFISYA